MSHADVNRNSIGSQVPISFRQAWVPRTSIAWCGPRLFMRKSVKNPCGEGPKRRRSCRTRRGQRVGDEDVDEADLEAERGDSDDAGQALRQVPAKLFALLPRRQRPG